MRVLRWNLDGSKTVLSEKEWALEIVAPDGSSFQVSQPQYKGEGGLVIHVDGGIQVFPRAGNSVRIASDLYRPLE